MRQHIRTIVSVLLSLLPVALSGAVLYYGATRDQKALFITGAVILGVMLYLFSFIHLAEWFSMRNVIMAGIQSAVQFSVTAAVLYGSIWLNQIYNNGTLIRKILVFFPGLIALVLAYFCFDAIFTGYIDILRWIYNSHIMARFFDVEQHLNRIISKTTDRRVLCKIALRRTNPPLSRIFAADRLVDDIVTAREVYADIAAELYLEGTNDELPETPLLADIDDRFTLGDICRIAKERLTKLNDNKLEK